MGLGKGKSLDGCGSSCTHFVVGCLLALVCLGECVRNCDLVGVGRPVGSARGAVAVHQLAQTFGRDGVDRVKHDANVRINGNKQLILPTSFTRLPPRPADSAWPGGSRQEAVCDYEYSDYR